jgi:hypothetical protein
MSGAPDARRPEPVANMGFRREGQCLLLADFFEGGFGRSETGRLRAATRLLMPLQALLAG